MDITFVIDCILLCKTQMENYQVTIQPQRSPIAVNINQIKFCKTIYLQAWDAYCVSPEQYATIHQIVFVWNMYSRYKKSRHQIDSQ